MPNLELKRQTTRRSNARGAVYGLQPLQVIQADDSKILSITGQNTAANSVTAAALNSVGDEETQTQHITPHPPKPGGVGAVPHKPPGRGGRELHCPKLPPPHVPDTSQMEQTSAEETKEKEEVEDETDNGDSKQVKWETEEKKKGDSKHTNRRRSASAHTHRSRLITPDEPAPSSPRIKKSGGSTPRTTSNK